MVKVKKSESWILSHSKDAEPYQEFNKAKIESALIRAGARGEVVKQVAATIKPYEGMTTEEIDGIVLRELETRDANTAKAWKIKRDYSWSRFKKQK